MLEVLDAHPNLRWNGSLVTLAVPPLDENQDHGLGKFAIISFHFRLLSLLLCATTEVRFASVIRSGYLT